MKHPIIYKYPIVTMGVGIDSIKMPAHAQILSAQMQDDIICIWALVDLNESVQEDYSILVVGTGMDLSPHFDKNWHFIDTVQDGAYVWHIFYKNNSNDNLKEDV